MGRTGRAAAGLSVLAGVPARDLLQREHTLLRTFPLIGHARYLLESVGPDLRQYLVAGDNEERPFTRWVYASAKKQNNYFGFGTDNDLEYTAGYPVINHRTFGRAVPATHVKAGQETPLPSAKVLGATRGSRSGGHVGDRLHPGTPRSSPYARPPTSRRCAATCARSPRRAAWSTRL